jgi:hypothetical protein
MEGSRCEIILNLAQIFAKTDYKNQQQNLNWDSSLQAEI